MLGAASFKSPLVFPPHFLFLFGSEVVPAVGPKLLRIAIIPETSNTDDSRLFIIWLINCVAFAESIILAISKQNNNTSYTYSILKVLRISSGVLPLIMFATVRHVKSSKVLMFR